MRLVLWRFFAYATLVLAVAATTLPNILSPPHL